MTSQDGDRGRLERKSAAITPHLTNTAIHSDQRDDLLIIKILYNDQGYLSPPRYRLLGAGLTPDGHEIKALGGYLRPSPGFTRSLQQPHF